jgi:hypothetical protein
VRSYRVRFFGCIATTLDLIDLLLIPAAGPKTRPRSIPRHAARHRLFPHPILRDPSWIFAWSIRRLAIVHLEEGVAYGSGHPARARNDRDRGSTECLVHRVRSQLFQPLAVCIVLYASGYVFFFAPFFFCILDSAQNGNLYSSHPSLMLSCLLYDNYYPLYPLYPQLNA